MRDPKNNPYPGDRLRKGKRVRVVVRNNGLYVWYVWDGSSSTPRTERVCWITTWQDWAKGADVLEVQP